MHKIVSVESKPASGNGDIAGFVAACSCGYKISNIFEISCKSDAIKHVDYMNEKELGRKD